MSLLLWLLAGVFLYTVVAMALRQRGVLPESFRVSGPLLTVHTKRGRQLLNRLARRKRFWLAWSNVGVGIAIMVMIGSAVAVVTSVIAILTQPESATIESPQNVLVIPGVNEFLPLSAAGEIIAGLVIGLIVHEGGHGLLCRVEDIEIDSMGVALFALIPLGAFVEPDAEDQESADRGSQIRMFAAGITNNFAITALVLLVLAGPVAGSIAVVDGAPVGDTLPGSAAAEAGIEQGDVITGIDGHPVDNATDLDRVLADSDQSRVEVSFQDRPDATVDRRVLITGAIPGIVDGIDLGGERVPRVERIDDTPVATEQDVVAAVEADPVVTIETDRGNATLPVGVYVDRVGADGGFAAAGVSPDDTPLVITHVADHRVSNTSALGTVLGQFEPGDEVTVEFYRPGETDPETVDVTLGSDDDDRPLLGVTVQTGYSGLVFEDFGADPYPAEQFLAMLSADAIPGDASAAGGALLYMGQLLILPFAAIMGGQFNYNFAGFTPDVAAFFAVEGPLGFLGGGLLLLANLLFWTGWINFNLALFNCIPAFPLDGGHILRATTESIVSRLPIERRRELVSTVTLSTTLVMLAALLVMVFGPQFL